MEKIKTPEEMLMVDSIQYTKIGFEGSWYLSEKEVVKILHEYGKQRHNEAIKAAAENAKAKVDSDMTTSLKVAPYIFVDKDSILKLLEP